jgi:hypothetical protein
MPARSREQQSSVQKLLQCQCSMHRAPASAVVCVICLQDRDTHLELFPQPPPGSYLCSSVACMRELQSQCMFDGK